MKTLNLVRTIILAGGLLLQLSALCLHSRGAAGDVDLSFDPGFGVNGTVNAIALQPNGKVIIGGEFTTVKGLMRSTIGRLNADGSGDSSFNAGTVPAGWGEYPYTHTVALQADGKVLVGHDNGISRLNSDGSQDTNFNAWIGPICGEESCYTGVYSIAVQSDGKVLIGGFFSTLSTNVNYGIARLNSDGSLDSSFNPGGDAGFVYSVVLQPDGKVLIGGDFATVNGTNRNGIARLNANGSLDTSFDPGTGANGIRSVVLQSDGKVLIGGHFTTVNGTNWIRIARLNASGSLDSSFNPGTGPNSGVSVVALQSDGKVLIGGHFTTVNSTNRSGIARLNADGSLDGSFDPSLFWDNYPNHYPDLRTMVVQSDGKVLIGGGFTTVNGTIRNSIARLNADGVLDGSFDPGTAVPSSVSSLVLQPDGKVLIGGLFTFINGTNRYGSARLNADGSVDSTFIPRSFDPYLGNYGFPLPYVQATAFAAQSDGKVLVGGYSLVYTNCDDSGCSVYYYYFVDRFNPDRRQDPSFERAIGDQPSPVPEAVQALAVQPDGKVVVAGYFNSIGGTNRNRIARLNANGSLDSTFNAGTNNWYVYSLALQPDGKMLIGGNLAYGGFTNRNGIARLNANGTLDSSFDSGTLASGEYAGVVWSIAVQPDGKVLIGGQFTTVNGTNRNHIARLNANGSLDSSFNPGTGADAYVRSIALQPDGNMLIGGNFFTVNGVVRPYVARLYGDSFVPSLNIARSNAFVIVSWPFPSTGFVLQQNTALNTTNWTAPSEMISDNSTTRFIRVSPGAGSRLYRLFKP